MNIKRTLLVAGTAGSVGLATTALAGSVLAAESSTESGLAQKIAQRFNLNQGEVQEVIDSTHQERAVARQQALEERLTQAVEDQKITAAQKSEILAKLKELRAQHPDFKDLRNKTPQQLHSEMQKHRTELEAWAKQRGILMEYLRPDFLIGGGPGRHVIRFEAPPM